MASNPAAPSNERLLAALEAQAGDDPVRLRTLALAQVAAGRQDEALASFERAVVLKPDYTEAWISLARFLIDLERPREAMAAAREATLLAPQDRLAWHLLGLALHALDLLDQAAEAQRRAIALDPEFRDGWRWLGYSLETDGDLVGAAQAYERALALRYEPKTALHLALLGPSFATDMAQIDWARERVPRELQRLVASGFTTEAPHRLLEHATGVYAYWGGDDLPLHRAFAEFCRRVAPGLIWRAPHVDGWQPPVGRKPRVAWVTYYVFPHTVERMWGGIARALPGFGFEVRVFTNYASQSAEREAMEHATGPVVVLPDDLDQARRAIAEFEPDIVIYPELGLNPFIYCLGFARLAPLQITSWGHAATSGLDEIDVFLGNSDLDPPGAERFYSEELVRLDPPPICYRRHLPVRTDSDLAFLKAPPDAKVYLCIQSLLKLRPDFDAVLAKILATDPNGVLVIVGRRARQSLRIIERRLAAAIPDWRRRVRLIAWLSDGDFAALLDRADAILDTHHFAGGHTSYDMIAQCHPFVTLPGPFSKGRVGAMLYRAIGVEELIARDEAHYVELAVRLANDRPWHEALAARIAAAAPSLDDWQPGLKLLADWLHARIAQMGKRQ
jgi:predicted O-linked N-acetylglucosamine transferase (SPINDLY family)